jgi:hypothetical protein
MPSLWDVNLRLIILANIYIYFQSEPNNSWLKLGVGT